MDNGRNFNLSKRLDSRDSTDEDCSVDYLIPTGIEQDTSDQSMNSTSGSSSSSMGGVGVVPQTYTTINYLLESVWNVGHE